MKTLTTHQVISMAAESAASRGRVTNQGSCAYPWPGGDTHGVNATFFMVGREVESFPGIAQRVLAEGHEVGNHSYSHPLYFFQRASATRQQVRRAQDVIAEAIGVRPTLARPPYGVRTPAYFGATRALKNVSFEVAPGEVHALIGENGAGKSTLMKILSGAYKPDAGSIELNGAPFTRTTSCAGLNPGRSSCFTMAIVLASTTVRIPSRHCH